jgi:hypothetical protein
MRHFHIRILLITATLAVSATVAAAQPWVSAKGELALTLRSDFQTSQGVWHGSQLVTGLPVEALNDVLAVEYVPLDHLALGLALNANGVRYSGPQMQTGGTGQILAHGSQDDGSFHWNVTDLDFDARYQLYDGAVALTPIVRVRLPVTSYEQKGYAAAGSHLAEGSLGFSVGRYGLGLEDLVLQASYAFTYVAKESGGGAQTEMYRVNRSDADLSLSYVINEKFIAGAGVAFRYTHDGFDLTQYPDLAPSNPLRTWHDPVLQVKYLAPTAVASYQLTPTWSLAARFAAVAWGRNTSNAISFGLTLGWENNLID